MQFQGYFKYVQTVTLCPYKRFKFTTNYLQWRENGQMFQETMSLTWPPPAIFKEEFNGTRGNSPKETLHECIVASGLSTCGHRGRLSRPNPGRPWFIGRKKRRREIPQHHYFSWPIAAPTSQSANRPLNWRKMGILSKWLASRLKQEEVRTRLRGIWAQAKKRVHATRITSTRIVLRTLTKIRSYFELDHVINN